MEPPVSSSRGPMGSLLWKLDWLESQRFLRNPVRKTFELLKEDLVGIDTLLLELSDEEDPNLMKKYWMKEVREICYDTEDYIDWLFHSQLKIGSVGVAPRLKISRLPRTLNPRPNIASQIKELRVRLQDASERHKRYVLDNNTSPSSSNFMRSQWIPEWSREAASLLVGIDDSKEKLIKLLNSGEKQLNVISISGLGGIGKTTLAKQILQELGWQFGCHAFVRASRKPDTRSLLRSILSQTGWRHHSEACNLQQLIEHLSEHLRHRRYLIAIDDLWETAVWDFLLCAFPDGTQSSRIITTTASETVAMACCGNRSDYILKMESLNDDDSRKLFCARVFGSEDKCPPQLKDASCEIVRKCGGVPLALIHIAGLLTRQQDKSEEWDYVERSLGSNLRISPTYEGMRKVINLSYNGLPQCLKTCLQYVSMYPENCTIWKDDLVRRWVAEGFIERDGERDNEEIAQSHFEEMVYRGMIQAIDMNYNDQVLSCIVHPMVLDFVTNKSAEDNFVTTVDYSQRTRELSSKVRRLFLFYHTAKYAARLSGITLLQVRSLAFYGLVKCLPSIREFKFLRVLVLHLWGDYNDPTILNLSGINRLFQLRYLKVTCNYFLQLPTHMSGLHRLETMEINAKVTSVPEDIVYLKYLVHLSLPRETKLPYGVGRLRSLRTLKCFDFCGNSDDEVKSLLELSCLEELQLVLTTAPSDSVDRNMKVLISILGYFCNLKSLVLFRGASVPKNSVYIIDSSGMSYPNSTEYLERLEFHRATCIFHSIPEWIGALRNLRIVKLGILEIQKNDVESLAGLQMLIFLSLYVQRPTAYQIVFNSGAFPALKCFKFRSRELCVAFRPGAMPELRRLKLSFIAYSGVNYSHMLDGIEHLLNLQEVSGRIGADVGAKECDTRMTESAFKNAIRRHSMIPRFDIQIVDWIEDDHVPAKNSILSKTKQVDHGIPGKESEDNTNKKADTRTSTIPDAVVNFSEVLSSEFFDGMGGVGPEVEEAPGNGKMVCVIGAGGHIGSWIVKLLLERGYTIRGTSRNPDHEKNAHLWNLPGAADRLTLCKADLLDYDALQAAVAGCHGVFHTASPITDDPEEMIEPAVRGTEFVLAAADAATVRRVVVTSSIAAVVLDPNRLPDAVVDESCWSNAEFCKRTRNWYSYGKMIAEEAAWDMGRQLGLDVVVVIPGLTLGPGLQRLRDNPSFSHVLKYLDGSVKTYANAVQSYVHVRDVADAHVRVFEAPNASGRYLCAVSVLHREDVVRTLHKYFPEYPVPKRCSDEVNPRRARYKISNQRLRELGMEFTSAEQALYETVRYFQEKGILPKDVNGDPIPDSPKED